MQNQRVYDLPTRLFHWTFAGMILMAGLITQTVDEEQSRFGIHMILGMVLNFSIFLRVIWGVIGTKYARFSSFALRPQDLIKYLKNVFNPHFQKAIGHNPASSWAALVMFILVLGLGMTGYGMVSGQDKFALADIHEFLAYALLCFVFLHLGGLLLHAVVFKDGLIYSMFTGYKRAISSDDIKGGVQSKNLWGLLFVCLVGTYLVYLLSQYDTQTGVLNFFGDRLQLIEDLAADDAEMDDD